MIRKILELKKKFRKKFQKQNLELEKKFEKIVKLRKSYKHLIHKKILKIWEPEKIFWKNSGARKRSRKSSEYIKKNIF